MHVDLVLLPQAPEIDPDGPGLRFVEMDSARDALLQERAWFLERHRLLLHLLVRRLHSANREREGIRSAEAIESAKQRSEVSASCKS